MTHTCVARQKKEHKKCTKVMMTFSLLIIDLRITFYKDNQVTLNEASLLSQFVNYNVYSPMIMSQKASAAHTAYAIAPCIVPSLFLWSQIYSDFLAYSRLESLVLTVTSIIGYNIPAFDRCIVNMFCEYSLIQWDGRVEQLEGIKGVGNHTHKLNMLDMWNMARVFLEFP